jgi:uncharacterized membrane protein
VSARQPGPEDTAREMLRHAPRRYTSAALTMGVLLAAVCFALALAAELVSGEPGSGELTDVAAVLDGLLVLDPWSWAALGVYVVVATPLLGLMVTAGEYASIGDRRAVGLAIAVIAVLAASAAVAVLR